MQDAAGNTVTTDTTGVTLTITTPGGATLGCTPDNGPLATVAGVATFAGCDIDLAGVTPYTLHAADGALDRGDQHRHHRLDRSRRATRVHDPAQHHRDRRDRLRPSSPSSPCRTRAATPSRGTDHAITLTITTPAGAALGCTPNTVNAIGGVATFAGCDIEHRGCHPYTLHAADGALAAATSTGITVWSAPRRSSAFVTQPSATATGGTDFAAQPQVAIQDAGGNTVTGHTPARHADDHNAGRRRSSSCTPDNGPRARRRRSRHLRGLRHRPRQRHALHTAGRRRALPARDQRRHHRRDRRAGHDRVHHPAEHHRLRRHRLRRAATVSRSRTRAATPSPRASSP